jgi:hypothetical protein
MAKPKRDPAREERIREQIIVDGLWTRGAGHGG